MNIIYYTLSYILGILLLQLIPLQWLATLLIALLILNGRRLMGITLVIVVALGAANYSQHLYLLKKNYSSITHYINISPKKIAFLSGIVSKEAVTKGHRYYARLNHCIDKNGKKLDGTFGIYYKGTRAWIPGDYIELSVTSLPDLRKSANEPESIFWTSSLVVTNLSAIQWKQISKNQLYQLLFSIKYRIVSRIQHLFPPNHSAFILGMILGISGIQLPEVITDQFKQVGLSHLLIVSGAQMAIITRMAIIICEAIFLPRFITIFLVITLAAAFTLLTGADVSILRAMLMAQIPLIASFLGRKSSGLQSLFFSALILLIINPLYLGNLGFLLSFFATFSLLEISPRLRIHYFSRLPNWIGELLATSLAPFLLTTPLLLLKFHSINGLSLLANMIIGFFSEWIVIIGFCTIIISIFSIHLAILPSWPVLGLSIFIQKTVQWLCESPIQAFYISEISWLIIIAYILWLIYCLYCEKINKIFQLWISTITIGLLIIASIFWIINNITDNLCKLVMLDVGQGDALLITYRHHAILIDGGDNTKKDMGKMKIIPYLNEHGINTLDAIILTHPHKDHYGGLSSILHSRPVKTFYYFESTSSKALLQRTPEEWKDYSNFLIDVRSHARSMIMIHAGQKIVLDKHCELNILYPEINDQAETINDYSIAILFNYYLHTILLTGDNQIEAETKISIRYPNLHASIIKIGHHGSQTSSTDFFLKQLHPTLALISVSAHNRFGHPNRLTLQRLKMNHIKTLRTDQVGTIEIDLEPQKIRLHTARTTN